MAEQLQDGGHNGIERIAGIKMNLGRMSMAELETLEANCRERLDNAKDDYDIVRDHRERRYPIETQDTNQYMFPIHGEFPG